MSEGITVNVNYQQLANEFSEFIGSNVECATFADTFVKGIFQREKNAMLKQFKDHIITKELEAGPDPDDNPSETLGGQKGNLFSYLGFYFTREPTVELEALLEKGTTITKSTRRGSTFYYRIKLPDHGDIENVTRMDWGNGNSWAFGVENGDFGGDAEVGHYIYTEYLRGRSTQGVQVKGLYSPNSFEPKSYLTPILENFIEKMNGGIT